MSTRNPQFRALIDAALVVLSDCFGSCEHFRGGKCRCKCRLSDLRDTVLNIDDKKVKGFKLDWGIKPRPRV